MKEVVAGVTVRDGRILLCQRLPNASYGYLWCSAGGQVEQGEDRFSALRREIREELGVVACDIGESVIAEFTADGMRVTFFPVAFREDPIPVEFIGLGWFTIADMHAMHSLQALTPANAGCVERISAYMKRIVGA